MSLANKYRPQTFDEMIGQEHIIDILKAQMTSRDAVHHNYLLFGPRGTGKTTSARLIAKGLNCLNLQNGNPCNHCVNCELINNGTSLDYVEIDAASHTGVDNIREEIIDKASYPPTALNKKIYVIDEVHMLSKGAFNALLKTIEEPKGNVCFILATTEIHKVPDTIISRCQVFNYRKVPNDAMINHLEKICKSENLGYEKSALEIIANISEGCVRDAVKYVDQVSILGDLNEENVARFLGVAGESRIKELLQSIKEKKRDEIFSRIDELGIQGIDLSQFAKQVLGYLDQHLLEDTDFYLNCSELFGNIISTLKWYPYPLIAYKMVINNYITGGSSKGEDNKIQNKPIENQAEKIIEKPVEIKQEVKNAESVVVNKETQETSGNQEGGTIQNPQNTNQESQNSTQDSQSNNQESQNNTQDSQNSTQNSPIAQTPINPGDFTALWSKVVSQMNKPTAQANLKDQAIIEKKQGEIVEITVITTIAKMLLENQDNKKLIEQLLSTELGEQITIQVSYVNKEEYFARKMGL